MDAYAAANQKLFIMNAPLLPAVFLLEFLYYGTSSKHLVNIGVDWSTSLRYACHSWTTLLKWRDSVLTLARVFVEPRCRETLNPSVSNRSGIVLAESNALGQLQFAKFYGREQRPDVG